MARQTRADWYGATELEVSFVARRHEDPPKKPYVDHVEIEDLKIFGVDVPPQALPSELLEKLHSLSYETEWVG